MKFSCAKVVNILNSCFFAIFATMKEASKQICLWFLTFSMILVIAGFNHIDSAFSNQYPIFTSECSGNPGLSHGFNFEDEIVISLSPTKSSLFTGFKELVPTLIVDFKNYYATSIWQPPKSV